MLVVVVSHVVAYRVVSWKVNLPVDRNPAALEWMFIAPAHMLEPVRPSPADVSVHSRATVRAQTQSAITTAPNGAPRDLAPPTDWNAELELVAKSVAATEGPETNAGKQRNLGFPSRAAATSTPSFDWDPVHTRRVETLPDGGGILIRLNDHCNLVFVPLPFIGCSIGKMEANGGLLSHMRDAPPAAIPPAP